MKGFLAALMVVALPGAAFAQDYDPVQEQRLADWRGGTQKAGLITMYLTVALGVPLAANKETLFSDGLCKTGKPMFGEFGCNGGLSIIHFIAAGSTLALYVASEILATEMVNSPYNTGDVRQDNARSAFRWTNVALFSLQPVLGVLAAHPWLIGIPPEARVMFSKVLRTMHFAVGAGLAGTYSVQAGLMW
jgi:hypothetical protein